MWHAPGLDSPAPKKTPHSADILYHLGKAQTAAGRTADAARTFRRVLLLSPHFEHAKEVKAFLQRPE